MSQFTGDCKTLAIRTKLLMRMRTTKYEMAATSTSSSSVSSSSVVNHYGSNQSMSAPSAVTVQVLSPTTRVVSHGDNGTVGYIWSV